MLFSLWFWTFCYDIILQLGASVTLVNDSSGWCPGGCFFRSINSKKPGNAAPRKGAASLSSTASHHRTTVYFTGRKETGRSSYKQVLLALPTCTFLCFPPSPSPSASYFKSLRVLFVSFLLRSTNYRPRRCSLGESFMLPCCSSLQDSIAFTAGLMG